MRNLTTNYTFTAGTRSITVTETFTVENIRLIVNETQKVVICSSMQKDNVSVTGNVITYSSSLPALQAGDVLTIELDNGVIPMFSTNAEIIEGKEIIASNLTAMGVTASASESLSSLGAKVLQAGVDVTVTPLSNYPSVWHDLYAVMASVYDPTNPYMYALLLTRDTPAGVLSQFVDGTVVTTGGQSDSGKDTMWVVFKRSSQNFSAAYTVTFASYIIGIAVYNADIKNVSFNGSLPTFLYFNSDYSVTPLEFTLDQFKNTPLAQVVTPNVDVKLDSNNSFNAAKLGSFMLHHNGSSLTINGSNIWQGASLFKFIMWGSLTSLTISGGYTWHNCTALTSFTLPPNLTSLTISGWYSWGSCTSLTSFIMPPNLTSLTISGSQTWNSCTSLTRITLNPNWRLSANFSSAPALNQAGLVMMIGELVDKRADGVNPTTVSTNSASPIVTGVNSQFTKVFVVGDTININGAGNRTIATIDSDTQLTLTANAAATGTGLAYNINKTLTVGATHLAKLTTAEKAVATDKGWTLA